MPIADLKPASAPLHFGRFSILPAERRLLVDGATAAIGARAFDLLMALVERHERVVTKSELLDAVWPRVVVEENNLQVHVSALRKLLGPDVIATVPGRGYRFAVPVSDQPTTPAAAALASELAAPAAAVAGNLPERLPALYGREIALEALQALLAAHALVTVIGPGGIGKTRLAQAAAHAQCGRFADGVWMIELASLQGPELVLPTIAQTLQITLPGHAAPQTELVNALRSQSLLLVLDNCEHVLDAVGPLVFALMRAAPGVRVLVTSQELLRVPDEQLYRLDPLAVPAAGESARATEYGAVRLFVERVRALDGRFRLSEANVEAVIEICSRLDGIALALELAAARVPMFGVEGIRERLGERLRVLNGGTRVSLRRHQTLRAALGWSHHLLGADEQKVFRRLGVFAGGFTIESAQQVASDGQIDDWAVIDHVSTLIDKSLLLVEDGPRPRYRLLETTRAYALEKLADAGETGALLRRHAQATLALLERAVKRRDVELLMQEMNNVRAAFESAMGADGDAATAIALATASSVVLAVEGLVVEALERLTRVEPLVDAATPPAQAAQFWQWLGRIGIDGRLPVARCIDALQRAEQMFRQQGNHRHLHACLRMRAEAMLDSGDLAELQQVLDEAQQMETAALPLADRMRRLRVQGLLEDRLGHSQQALATYERAYQLAVSAEIERYELILLADISAVHLKLGHAAEAARRFDALAENARRRPGAGLTLGYALAGLCAALITDGQLAEARRVAEDAAPRLRRSGIFTARADIFAWLLAREGRMAAAAQLAGAADAFHRRSGSTRSAHERQMREAVDSLVRAAAAPADIEHWLAEGALSGDDALMRLLA
jgi:predicted ATPase/DNA-binding winged helix-turn-helix (wHTH) protein